MVGCCIEDLRRFSDISAISRQEITNSKNVVVRPGIEPRTSCSVSQELNHYITAAPCVVSYEKMSIWRLKRFLYSFCIYFVAKFYGRLRLIPSVLRASKLSVLKIDKNCVILWVYYTVIFYFNLFGYFYESHDNLSQNFGWLRIADVWRFNTRIVYVVHILIIQSNFKMVHPA